VQKLRNVRFVSGNALSMPFEDESFDVVYCNNVTSFIHQRDAAVREYYRLLRPSGYLAAVPIYYVRKPPGKLIERVEKAIGAKLQIRSRAQWIDLFGRDDSALMFCREYEYSEQSADAINKYTEMVMAQPHMARMSMSVQLAVRRRLHGLYELFNENLRYCRFSILLFQRLDSWSEPILFRTRPVI
jgi:ubiquinone/menaquinone biosynthesis C-methylase UbiE